MFLRHEHLKRTYSVRGVAKTVLDLDQGHIGHGRITGIIGPNGAGKSTFLNIIAGIDRPSAGCVLYGIGNVSNGKTDRCDDDTAIDYSAEAPYERITLLFQQPYLIHTTVERNIAYPLRLRKWSHDRIKKRVDELMTELGLTTLAKQQGWRLSGGETQKVAFARALSFNPDLLLMDEPTSNIDNTATADIEALLKKTNREDGLTIIMISHNLAQIRRLCDDVLFMNRGRIIEAGPASDLLANPRQAETRAFIEGELLI